MLKNSILILLALSTVFNAVFFLLYINKRAKLSKLNKVYKNLHGESGLENVLQVLAGEMMRFGTKVTGIFIKNRQTGMLESKSHAIPMFEHSSMAKSFYSMKTIKNNEFNDNDKDRFISKNYGNYVKYIPIAIKWESPCWQLNQCQDSDCSCYLKNEKCCWIKSGKRYRGHNLKTFKEKTIKCLNCPSFLPVGVYAANGTGHNKSMKFINKFSDVVKTAIDYEKAKHSALKDYLTGLFNKMTFLNKTLELMNLSKRYNTPLSLCMFDIDHFKSFNDKYGHHVGDFVLKKLAEFIERSVRVTDVVGRYGGEEFTILLPGTKKDAAHKFLDELREKVDKEKFQYEGVDHQINISMGVTEQGADECDNVQDIFRKADIALYNSKKYGRNCVTSYRDGLTMPKKKDNEKKIVKPEKIHHTPPEVKSKHAQEVSDIINIKKDKQAKSEPEVSEVL